MTTSLKPTPFITEAKPTRQLAKKRPEKRRGRERADEAHHVHLLRLLGPAQRIVAAVTATPPTAREEAA